MEVKIENGKFTITGDCTPATESGSGKTKTIFTTHGLRWLDDGKHYVNLTIGERKEE